MSEKRKRWFERRAKRIEAKWEQCRGWFGGTGEGEERIEIHLPGVLEERLRRALKAVDRFTEFQYSSSVWVNPADFHPECQGHDALLAELEAGRVSAYDIHYEVEHAGVMLPMVLSIQRLEPRGVSVVAQTRHELLDPETTLRQRFEAVAVHGMDLRQWFSPCLLLIALRGEGWEVVGKVWVG